MNSTGNLSLETTYFCLILQTLGAANSTQRLETYPDLTRPNHDLRWTENGTLGTHLPSRPFARSIGTSLSNHSHLKLVFKLKKAKAQVKKQEPSVFLPSTCVFQQSNGSFGQSDL